MDKNRLMSPWAYFGYSLLFSIPIVGLVLLIVYSFDNSYLNRKNYARSYFIGLILALIIIGAFLILSAMGFGILSGIKFLNTY